MRISSPDQLKKMFFADALENVRQHERRQSSLVPHTNDTITSTIWVESAFDDKILCAVPVGQELATLIDVMRCAGKSHVELHSAFWFQALPRAALAVGPGLCIALEGICTMPDKRVSQLFKKRTAARVALIQSLHRPEIRFCVELTLKRKMCGRLNSSDPASRELQVPMSTSLKRPSAAGQLSALD